MMFEKNKNKPCNPEPIILGIDPGVATIGYGIIKIHPDDSCEPIDYGIISTPAKTPLPDRLAQIYTEMQALIQHFQPDEIAIEELFFSKNAKTAMMVGHGRGVILLACQTSQAPLFEYTPLQIKQGISGYGKANKSQVQQMVRIILGLEEIPKPDDAADALAVAVCQANHRKSIEHFTTNGGML